MPNAITQQLESHIQAFVTEISALVRTAALDSVHAALGATATPMKRGPGRPKSFSPKAAKGGTKSMPARPTRGGRRVKRSSEDVDAMAQKILAYVKANDGKRMDEIAKAMNTSVKNLTLPALKLLEAKAVKRSGQRRGTKYHVGSGGAASPKPESAKTAKRAKKT